MHPFKRRPLAAAIAMMFSAPLALAQAQSETKEQPQPKAIAEAARETTLPEVKVKDQAELADGPVTGYRATRSSTATKTDTPLKEVPASVSVVPAQVMKDTGMQSLGDVFRYVPGVLMHQGEGNRDQIVLRGNSTTADFYVDGVRDDAGLPRSVQP